MERFLRKILERLTTLAINKMEDKAEEFLIKNKISFENLIRSFNFWNELSFEEKRKYTRNYENGKYKNIGYF